MIESATVKLTLCNEYYKTKEINRGRLETRIVHVFEATKEIKEYLPHINAVVRVKRIRENKKQISEELIYYISDVKYTAKRFYKGIREHWSIENKLHWVKDVVMMEDKSTITNPHLAPIISLLRSHVIELAYINHSGVTNFLRNIAHNIEQMHLLLE